MRALCGCGRPVASVAHAGCVLGLATGADVEVLLRVGLVGELAGHVTGAVLLVVRVVAAKTQK